LRLHRDAEERDPTNVKRIALVTGGAGFIGSHVVDALLAESYGVVVVDDLSTGRADAVPDGAHLECVDITDKAALDRVVDTCRPSTILHLAAQSSVTRSVADPTRDAEINVVGTMNLLEAARRHRIPLVFTSTGGALYGDRAPLPTSEDAIPAPISPYGASKWSGEAYVVTWREADGIPHAVCRLGNVYGPRQRHDGEAGVVAILSDRLWRGEAPTLYGFGKPTRDYVHVHDVARALLAAIGTAGTFNVATGTETPVSTIFELLQSAAGTSLVPQLAPLREGELNRSCMDPSRAAEHLGWRPTVELHEGLRRTYEELVVGFAGAAPSD
jgi:UDP-glucose 4-epimerase